MLRKKGHPSFCIHHAREEQQRLESEKLAAEFASLSGKLNTVTDINHVLGKVFTAASRTTASEKGRLDLRPAVVGECLYMASSPREVLRLFVI